MIEPGESPGTAVVREVENELGSTRDSFASFESAIEKLHFVLVCHLVAGDFDYFLKIRVRDIADFNKLHGEQLIALPGVRQIRSFFVMKEVTDNAELEF